MTQRETILRDLLERMNTGRPSDVPVAERLRFVDIEQGELPALIIAPASERVVRAGSARSVVVHRELRFLAIVYAQGSTDPTYISCDSMADSTLAWITKTLGGLEVKGLVTAVDEHSLKWEYMALERPTVRATVELSVTYQTRVNDAEQRA